MHLILPAFSSPELKAFPSSARSFIRSNLYEISLSFPSLTPSSKSSNSSERGQTGPLRVPAARQCLPCLPSYTRLFVSHPHSETFAMSSIRYRCCQTPLRPPCVPSLLRSSLQKSATPATDSPDSRISVVAFVVLCSRMCQSRKDPYLPLQHHPSGFCRGLRPCLLDDSAVF